MQLINEKIPLWRVVVKGSGSERSQLRGQEGVSNDFNLDRDLSLPLKSLSPRQPAGWNDPYRMFHFGDSPKRLISNCKLEKVGTP